MDCLFFLDLKANFYLLTVNILSEVPQVLLLVSLCACERVTSDFEGIALVGKLRSLAQKKKYFDLETLIHYPTHSIKK